MKFAASVAMAEPDFYLPLAQAAEESGFDVVNLSDSICYPEKSDSTYPYNDDGTREFLENKPFLETMIAMAAMAAVTTRVEFCPFVMKLPIRHPVLFAKEATSLAVLADNRIHLGVGTSPWPDDYQIVGLPWAGRGRRFEECIEILRGLATGEYFEYHGEFYDFPPIKLNPVPSQPIPILIGGISRINVERAGRIGNGWMPTGIPMERMLADMHRINDIRRELGRDKERFDFYGAGMPTADGVRQLEDLGFTHFMGGFAGGFDPYGLERDLVPLQDKIDALHRFGDEVIAKVR